MRVQYCSDLHIEHFPQGTPFDTFVNPVAPILVLAGDICPVSNRLYEQFLQWCKTRWSTVVLITGNHEYFCHDGEIRTFDETDAIVRTISNRLGIHFLQAGQSVVAPDTNLRFVGATFWSDIDPAIWFEIEKAKGDFLQTYQNTGFMIRNSRATDLCALHALHKAYLRSALVTQSVNEQLIVVTHHMPTMELLESRYKTHPLRTCYASANDSLCLPNVAAWICGHGHRATTMKVHKHGPTFCMNARGYPSQIDRVTDIYNPDAAFIVKN